MTNQSIIELYKSQIAEIKVKMQKSQTRFETEEYKNCNRYPSYMHEEMHVNKMDRYASSIEQLEKLILELL